MEKTAVFWIRDGVLIDRMPVNAVAFAVSSLTHSYAEARSKTNLSDLINFAFAVSGISCADKMEKFNRERFPLINDVAQASRYYNELAGRAANHCRYFDGACDLLRELKSHGRLNFITSAVDQSVLDAWADSDQGRVVVPHIEEILARRSSQFTKGRAHFAYVHERYGIEKIFYVADAVSEIATGAELSSEFNIVPVGFANLITPQKISSACQLVMKEHDNLQQSASDFPASALDLDQYALRLPGEDELVASLRDAKAKEIVTGSAGDIMANLAAYLETALADLV